MWSWIFFYNFLQYLSGWVVKKPSLDTWFWPFSREVHYMCLSLMHIFLLSKWCWNFFLVVNCDKNARGKNQPWFYSKPSLLSMLNFILCKIDFIQRFGVNYVEILLIWYEKYTPFWGSLSKKSFFLDENWKLFHCQTIIMLLTLIDRPILSKQQLII